MCVEEWLLSGGWRAGGGEESSSKGCYTAAKHIPNNEEEYKHSVNAGRVSDKVMSIEQVSYSKSCINNHHRTVTLRVLYCKSKKLRRHKTE
jgi:hypothetical protein